MFSMKADTFVNKDTILIMRATGINVSGQIAAVAAGGVILNVAFSILG